jgi:DNA damage-binding protein 1
MIKSVVYGGLDGVLTTFAIVSGAAGGQLSAKVVLILGVSNIIADAISMGVGDALSSIAHQDYVLSEYNREKRNIALARPTEVKAMIETYVQKGLPRDKARVVVNTLAKYDDIFLEVLMVEKLQLQLPEDGDSPWRDGFVTFCSFTIFGTVPLLMYVSAPLAIAHATRHDMFMFACSATGLVLFALGVVTSCFSVKSWLRSGVEFLFMGGSVAVVAYLVGALVHWIGLHYLQKYITVHDGH